MSVLHRPVNAIALLLMQPFGLIYSCLNWFEYELIKKKISQPCNGNVSVHSQVSFEEERKYMWHVLSSAKVCIPIRTK